MEFALREALKAESLDEVPVGAVVVLDNQVIASASNEVILKNDPTAHAEILALQKACALLKTSRLENCDLYVTLEPCPMCAQAISFARIRRLYFGAYDPKGGGVDHGPRIFSQLTCHHCPDVYGGIKERDCADVLKKFFHLKR
jgi:tRNA(Arg) A34 adenosine deaminase TadA